MSYDGFTPDWGVLELICLGPLTESTRKKLREYLAADLNWGQLLESALRHRMLAMLAHELIAADALSFPPLRISEFLRSTLALNKYRRQVWYRELDRVMAALQQASVPSVVRKGGAYESTIYGGNGSRWMGDIDLLIQPESQPETEAILTGLGYESGLYDDASDQVIPFDRKELIKYRLNPDHLPTYSLRTGDSLVPVIEVDCAMSLTWARAPYQVPVADVLANPITAEIDVPPLVTFRTAQPAYQFLDTVLHLFREAWFEWWLDREQDVDLMKFGDVIRMAEAYEPHLGNGQFADLAERYDVRSPVCWVLEHADRAFSLNLRKSLGLAGHISEEFLASAASSGPDVPIWNADMRTRLRTKDRRELRRIP